MEINLLDKDLLALKQLGYQWQFGQVDRLIERVDSERGRETSCFDLGWHIAGLLL